MTADELELIDSLRCCRFLPGSWEKRFVHDLAGFKQESVLSQRQRESLLSLGHRYRKQLTVIREKKDSSAEASC